jgi:hypothetical protein
LGCAGSYLYFSAIIGLFAEKDCTAFDGVKYAGLCFNIASVVFEALLAVTPYLPRLEEDPPPTSEDVPRGTKQTGAEQELKFPPAVSEVLKLDDIPQAALAYVSEVLTSLKSWDKKVILSASRACCRSVAPSTLMNYVDLVK